MATMATMSKSSMIKVSVERKGSKVTQSPKTTLMTRHKTRLLISHWNNYTNSCRLYIWDINMILIIDAIRCKVAGDQVT